MAVSCVPTCRRCAHFNTKSGNFRWAPKNVHIEYRSFWLFTHVQTLKIDEQSSPTPLKREALVELFLLTKDLRRLDLIDTGLDFVKDLHSVDPHCKSSSADPKGGAPLPHLSKVTLRRVSRYIKGRRPDTLASLVDALLAWIAFRSERGDGVGLGPATSGSDWEQLVLLESHASWYW